MVTLGFVQAYFNGKFFHNGTLEDKNIKFYGEQPSYT
jgi:hypothetical protein